MYNNISTCTHHTQHNTHHISQSECLVTPTTDLCGASMGPICHLRLSVDYLWGDHLFSCSM